MICWARPRYGPGMTDDQARRSRWPWLVGGGAVLAAAVVVVVVVLSSGSNLGDRDPTGALACRGLQQWAAGNMGPDPLTSEPYTRGVVTRIVSEKAATAATGAIRTAGADESLDELRTACIAAGVNVHALPSD